MSSLTQLFDFGSYKLAIAVVAVVLTFVCPLIAVPGRTMMDGSITKRGWLAIFIALLALLAQGGREFLQECEDEQFASNLDQRFDRLEMLLASQTQNTTLSAGASAKATGTATDPAADPSDPPPDSGFPEPPALPTAIQNEMDGLREFVRSER